MISPSKSKHRAALAWASVAVCAALFAVVAYRRQLNPGQVQSAGVAPSALSAQEIDAPASPTDRALLVDMSGPASAVNDSLDAAALRELLRSGELRWRDMDDAQRVAVGRLIARDAHGTLSPQTQRDMVQDILVSRFEPLETEARSDLDDVGRLHLAHLKEQYMREALPLAESAVAAIAADMLLAWDRGDGLVIWQTTEGSAPTASECDQAGHLCTESRGLLAPGYEFHFSYCSARSPVADAALDGVRQMRTQFQRTWRDYASNR